MKNKRIEKKMVKIPQLECTNCMYNWQPRVNYPKKCPNCGHKLGIDKTVKNR